LGNKKPKKKFLPLKGIGIKELRFKAYLGFGCKNIKGGKS